MTRIDARDLAELRQVVQAELDATGVPGAAVGVLIDGQRETLGVGTAHRGTGQPVTADCVFRIGSISKVFASVLALQLVEEGVFTLDEPIARYLPGIQITSEHSEQVITLRHLLSHQSCLCNDFFDDFGLGDDALSKMLARFAEYPQVAPPGFCWKYTNCGFYLTAGMIERAIGIPYETAMRERVLTPLGLNDTTFFLHDAVIRPLAIGHDVEGASEPLPARFVVADQAFPRNQNPSGGVYSTASDLLTFAMFLMGSDPGTASVLQPATRVLMREPQVRAELWADAWCLGVDHRSAGDVSLFGHGGSTNGYTAQLTFIPERNAAISILTNGDSSIAEAPTDRIEAWILDRWLGLRRPEPQPRALSHDALAAFAGQYRDLNSLIEVTTGDGILLLRQLVDRAETDVPALERMGTVIYAPIGERRFVKVDDELGSRWTNQIAFVPGTDGAPLYLHTGSMMARREA